MHLGDLVVVAAVAVLGVRLVVTALVARASLGAVADLALLPSIRRQAYPRAGPRARTSRTARRRPPSLAARD